jgi:dihydrolipoamide dehydrogenase
MHSQLVVLGGGPGGYTAAFLAADLGMQVTLVELESRLGGVCLLRGCIPSKALLHVAKHLREADEMQQWGVHYSEPSIDLDTMRARKEKVIETLSGGLQQLAKQRKVKVIQARGSFADSQTLYLQGGDAQSRESDVLTFDHCILAVGSRPVVPKSLRLDSPLVMDSKAALDLAEVPPSLLVVGGGYIGLEMGSVYAALGSKVTVVEFTSGLLPGVDRDLVKPLQSRLKQQFEALRFDTKVESLALTGNEVEATLSEGDETEKQRFSRVLISVGRRPRSAGIGLENTQVELDERGFVKVDDQQRSTDPNILAIGDIAGEPMLAHKASYEGRVAVEVLSGHPAAFDAVAIPAVVFTDPEIAWAGLTETQAKQQGLKVEVTRYPWAASGRAQALARTDGLTKLIVDPDTERVLGVGMCGCGAGELIAEGVLAIEMGCMVRDLTGTIHPHPTLSETVAFSAEMYLGLATEVYRPKRDKPKRSKDSTPSSSQPSPSASAAGSQD